KIDLPPQVALFQVIEQEGRPAPAGVVRLRSRKRRMTIDLPGFGPTCKRWELGYGSRRSINIARRQGAIAIGIEVHREADLLEIVLTVDPTRCLPRLLYRGEQ